VAFILLAALTTLAIEFRPFRTGPLVNVVAHGDTPVPWKAPLPDQLPMPTLPAIPPPPLISPPAERRSAIDAILPKGVSAPESPEARAGYATKR
jgi:hypothetical protein